MGKKSTGTGRTPREGVRLEARRTEIFRLWREGQSLAAIGRKFKMSRQLVSLDCKLAIREFRDSNRASVGAQIELEVDYLNDAQAEIREAFEAEKGKKGRDRLADACRYADSVSSLSRERRKLLGIDKPTRVESQVETTALVRFQPTEEIASEIRKMAGLDNG